MTDERLQGSAATVTGEEVLAAARFVLAEGVSGPTTSAMGMAAGVGGQNQLLTSQAEGEAAGEAESLGPPAFLHHRVGARHLEFEDTESGNRLVFVYGRHHQDDDTKSVVRELTE